LKSEGTQPVVKDELMREVRFLEMDWRRESSGQVVGWPDFTSHRISSGERGEKEVKV
jgi:hypothetical protein